MKLIELTFDEYSLHYPEHQHVFGATAFAQLNADKVNKVVCLSLVNDKAKHIAGLIVGERADGYACPFSAPFGEICCPKPLGLEAINTFVDILKEWLGGKSLKLTMAPSFYNPQMHDKLCGILARKAKSQYFDFNYHYPIDRFESFTEHLDRSARKNFNRAKSADFVFEKTNDVSRAYAVIEQNRREHGYPLRMILQQVLDTVDSVIKADAFVMSHKGTDIASAIVFHVAPNIVQVIYWGDINGYSELRPMNYLSYKVFEHYHNSDIRIVDIGPSSEQGVPSYGLCNFKESIGCVTTLKPTFYL
jgi:hypothetical protein